MELDQRSLAYLIWLGDILDFTPRKLIKHRERDPKAPEAPVYVNLRVTPDGPVTHELADLFGKIMWMKTAASHFNFSGVVGVPRAGNPFAAVIAKCAGVPLYPLEKDAAGHVAAPPGLSLPAGPVLIVNDVISQADSALQAVSAVRRAGGEPGGIAVLVDREQGGSELLEWIGIRVHAAMKLRSDILPFLRSWGKISHSAFGRSVQYLDHERRKFLGISSPARQ